MHNALLATFHNQPALVSSGAENVFASFLNEASATLARLQGANDNIVMADDFWFSADDWRSAYRPYIVTKDGILLIPVKGVLLHDMGYALGNWATGYVYITKALERGLADADVKGIAFICDSPGGHVAGNFDLVDKIYAARGIKPMRGFASESAYSACYSIISSVDPGQVTVSRTGGVGSIGVVTVHYDYSKMLENDGIKITFITYGAHKADGNSTEPLSAEVEARIKARITVMGELFVSTVARNRGLDAQVIRDTEALTFTAAEATSNGLADKIGSLDDAIAVFAADLSSNDEDETMTTRHAPLVDKTAVDNARSAGYNQGITMGEIQGHAFGASSERERIDAILTSKEGKERPAAALAAAMETHMTVEQVRKFLGKLPEEKPNTVVPMDRRTVRDNGLSRAEQAMLDAGFPPKAAAADSARELSRAEQALADAGYKPR